MQQTLIVPYLRTSPMYDARRDLVAHAGESWLLRLTVIERDDPCAELLVLTGGLGGPAAYLALYPDPWPPYRWDYGRVAMQPDRALYAAWGAPQAGLGSFDWHLPAGTFTDLPANCRWTVQLVWDAGTKSDMLSQGKLHITGAGTAAVTGVEGALSRILTDGGDSITTDDGDTITSA